MSIAISAKGLGKSFKGIEVLRDLDLSIQPGSITAILGPNGSGKSTLLNILGGTLSKDAGQLEMDPLKRFEFSYIFQNYRESLLPWRTCFENVALPLEIQGKNLDEIQTRVNELQDLLGFSFNWEAYPYELSGGQQQILAFMRALVTKPQLLFIDETFSALDYENNLRLREYLQKYYLAFRPTILLVTHNIEEAVHLAQQIIVLSRKPAKIIRTINNAMAYPRTMSAMKSTEFDQTKALVLSAFQEAANL